MIEAEEDLVTNLLELRHSVIIGSTGLGVSTESSDIDICVLDKELETIGSFLMPTTTPNEYEGDYDASPLLRNAILYKEGNVDIFVFTDPLKLVILTNVMDKLNDYPKAFTRIKWIRVKMFRYYLRQYNF